MYKMRANRLQRREIYKGWGSLLPHNTIMAEVGSFAGESAELFLMTRKVRHITCVDLWSDENNYGTTKSAPYIGQAEKDFKERMSLYNPVMYDVLKTDSVEGASYFKDRSLDFVYIDADHIYKYVKADIEAWLPKVKIGGIIAGHDYKARVQTGVKQAVHEIFGEPEFKIGIGWGVRVS